MGCKEKLKTENLKGLFDPVSVAVVGASPNPSKGGNRPLRFLTKHGFTGKIYPVNIKYDEVADLQCYPSLVDIPGPVDLAMITVPEKQVSGVLHDCIEKGTKLVVIRTAFTGSIATSSPGAMPFGKLLRGSSLRIMGPSSLGFVNVYNHTPAYFHVCLDMQGLIAGRIGFISQSGGLSGVIFNKLQDRGAGLSYIFSTGIETDLETSDYIDFLVEDSHTSVITCFIEGFKNEKGILRSFERAANAGKPIIMMKIGRSELGRKAAKSHTGKLVGKDEIWNAIFKQKNVIRVQTIEELVETSSFFAKCEKCRGERLGIVAASGGSITVLSDQAGSHGITLTDLNEPTKTELHQLLPEYASIHNPLDVGPVGDERYLQCLKVFSRDPNIDLILLPLTILPNNFGTDRARRIVALQETVKKPLVILWLGGSLIHKGIDIIEKSGIPLFRSEDICIRVLKSFTDYLRFQSSRHAASELEVSQKEQKVLQGYMQGEGASSEQISREKRILEHFGIPVAREGIAKALDEAIGLAQGIGYPIALKVVSPQIVHKTEFDAVKLNIRNDDELEKQYHEIVRAVKRYDPNIQITGITVQEMVMNGVEFLLGMHKDPELGPIITCGFGGVFVELLKDIAISIPPLTYSLAKQMLSQLKGYAILQGFRGKKKLDVNALIEIMVSFSQMCVLLSKISDQTIEEMEINPLMVLEEGQGARAVDYRILRGGVENTQKRH